MKNVKITFGGVITALCVVTMLLTAIIPIASYSLPAIAGVIIISAVIEFGSKFAVYIFSIISVISLIIVPDKEAVLLFISFFGYYPIIKQHIERLNKKFVELLIKFIIFNLAAIINFYFGIFILEVPRESFMLFGMYLPFVILMFANVVFFLYDFTLTGLVSLYIERFHDKIKSLMNL